MAFTNQTLLFESQAVDSDTLLIAKLEGVERVSGLFRFELELISPQADIDLGAVLAKPAKIGLKEQIEVAGGATGWTTHWISGELESFTQAGQGEGWTGYRAVLVPRLAALRDSYRSRVFMDTCAPDIVKSLLTEAGLADGDDFEFSDSIKEILGQDPTGRASYPQREYVVQFEESDLDFVSRWLEHEGIFYVFDNTDSDAEKLLLCDSVASYKGLRGRRSFPYSPQGSMGGSSNAAAGWDLQKATFDADGEIVASDDDSSSLSVIHTLSCAVTRLPKEVVLNDYNWRTPDSTMRCSAEVDSDGRGVQYEYNYHYKTTDQGKALAKVVAEGLIARSRVFNGAGTCRNLRAGFTFELSDHPRDDFNQGYFLTEVRHSATQEISLETSSMSGSTYACEFEAIPASEVFRAEPTTEWPAIRGAIQAKIDGKEEDGQYAELDAEGRYKVTLPFDVDGGDREPGQASRYMRLSTPYAGSNEGMHFPLRPGTEVLLTHIDGDPDRPVISGAVPNPNNPSRSDSSNQSQSVLQTSSGNSLKFQDEGGREGITLKTASGGVYQCFTRPGSMGSGGGNGGSGSGSGGAAGAGRGAKPEASARAQGPRAEASLPGAGHGSSYSQDDYYEDDDANTVEGADEYWQDCESSLSSMGVSSDDWAGVKERWAKSFSPNGTVGSDNEGKDYTSSTVIAGLNDVCSSFSAYIGCYDTFIGPYTTVKMGDYGEWQEGDYKHDTSVFKKIWENTDPPEKDTGEIHSRVGKKRRWNKITEEINAKNYLSKVGSADSRPEEIRNVVQGEWCHDELWATIGVVQLYGAPMVFELDLAALHTELHTGIRFDISVGVTTSLALVDNSLMLVENGARVVENMAWVSRKKAKVAEFEATVAENSATISDSKARVALNAAFITKNMAAISEARAAISDTKAAISKTNSALNETNVNLNKTTTAMIATDACLAKNISALVTKVGLP